MAQPDEPAPAGQTLANPELLDWLLELQRGIQRLSIQTLRRQPSEHLAAVARESAGDTIYEIDRGLDELIEADCERLGARHTFVLVAEGGTRIYPAGAAKDKAALTEEDQVSWLGYANRSLQARIEPILQELFTEYGLIP